MMGAPIRSRFLNGVVLFVGVVFLCAAANLWAEGLRLYGAGFPGQDVPGFVEGVAFFAIALWCAWGAIRNFRESSRREPHEVDGSQSIVKVHLIALGIGAVAYAVAALGHWQWQLIGLGPVKAIHYSVVALFALIPVTIVVSLLLRARTSGPRTS